MKRTRWTYEKAFKESLPYKTLMEFKKKSPKAYDWFVRNSMTKNLVHLTRQSKPKGFWTNDKIYEVAAKYETRKEFIENDPTAYARARERGIGEDACLHMGNKQSEKWSYNRLHKIALQYDDRASFKNANRGAYSSAGDKGVLNDICSHMTKKYSDSDMVYFWEIPNTNIFKIGISSVRLGERRIKQVADKMGVDYEIIGMYEVDNAMKIEKELHNTYQIVPTTLPKRDGYTEFRILTESDVNEITYYLENIVGKRI